MGQLRKKMQKKDKKLRSQTVNDQ